MGLVNLLPFLRALQKSTPDDLSADQSNEGSDDAEAPPPEARQNQTGLGTPGPSLYAATGQQQQQASPSQPQGNQQASPTSQSNADSFPKVETPSAEDIANGNYIIEGRRHLLVNGPGQIGLHDYTKIPVIENGKVKLDQDGKPVYERWGVLGNPGSDKNQQVRDDPRNDQFKGREGSEVWVKVTPEQREALRQGMQYFAQTDENGNFIHPCPVCGDRYGRYDRNSNTFQYNMRFWNPAGPIPSQKGPFWTLGEWKNEPNEQWYQPQEPK